jgi:hypothetical protein
MLRRPPRDLNVEPVQDPARKIGAQRYSEVAICEQRQSTSGAAAGVAERGDH